MTLILKIALGLIFLNYSLALPQPRRSKKWPPNLKTFVEDASKQEEYQPECPPEFVFCNVKGALYFEEVSAGELYVVQMKGKMAKSSDANSKGTIHWVLIVRATINDNTTVDYVIIGVSVAESPYSVIETKLFTLVETRRYITWRKRNPGMTADFKVFLRLVYQNDKSIAELPSVFSYAHSKFHPDAQAALKLVMCQVEEENILHMTGISHNIINNWNYCTKNDFKSHFYAASTIAFTLKITGNYNESEEKYSTYVGALTLTPHGDQASGTVALITNSSIPAFRLENMLIPEPAGPEFGRSSIAELPMLSAKYVNEMDKFKLRLEKGLFPAEITAMVLEGVDGKFYFLAKYTLFSHADQSGNYPTKLSIYPKDGFATSPLACLGAHDHAWRIGSWQTPENLQLQRGDLAELFQDAIKISDFASGYSLQRENLKLCRHISEFWEFSNTEIRTQFSFLYQTERENGLDNPKMVSAIVSSTKSIASVSDDGMVNWIIESSVVKTSRPTRLLDSMTKHAQRNVSIDIQA